MEPLGTFPTLDFSGQTSYAEVFDEANSYCDENYRRAEVALDALEIAKGRAELYSSQCQLFHTDHSMPEQLPISMGRQLLFGSSPGVIDSPAECTDNLGLGVHPTIFLLCTRCCDRIPVCTGEELACAA